MASNLSAPNNTEPCSASCLHLFEDLKKSIAQVSQKADLLFARVEELSSRLDIDSSPSEPSTLDFSENRAEPTHENALNPMTPVSASAVAEDEVIYSLVNGEINEYVIA